MSCFHPLLAANLGQVDGKYKIKILPKRFDKSLHQLEELYGDDLLLLPCGCCPGCKMAHQKQWSVRCELESQYHKENCMITLTYSEDRVPKKLIKRDLQKFIKDLRNKGLHFRYFACGEYGSSGKSVLLPFGRPHFHVILFGYWPADAKFEYNSKSGFPLYSSKFIESVWKNGIITVSEMAPGTAAYVAGYVDKKLGQDEFILMSKKPGIGERYLREHLFDIYAYDNLVGAFGVAKVPRYYDKLADQMFYDLEDLKLRRKKASNYALIESMQLHNLNYKEQALDFAAFDLQKKFERKKRL